jgi:hypothetical protein
MYLGRLFSFNASQDTELKHRVGKAWAKFAIFRDELTDKHYNLDQRLRLFKAVVQPSFLYGSVCWTMTRKREQYIRTAQRKMVRTIIGSRRKLVDNELEDWVD